MSDDATMGDHLTDPRRQLIGEVLLGVVVPLVLIGLIIWADVIEGPKTAYVGVLTAIPILAAVFARPSLTALVGMVTLIAADLFGRTSSDGNVRAQTVRLIIIAIGAVVAIIASTIRLRRDRRLAEAMVLVAKGERAREQAITDPLTGLRNRRGIEEAFTGLTDGPTTIVMIDVDRLKKVNDQYGHGAGDDYIRAVATRLAANVARTDIVGRWGGDEFLLVLPVGVDAARTIMERVVARVTAEPVVFDGGAVRPGISVGMAELDGGSLDDAVALADQAMYDSKRVGSNIITVGG